MQVQVLMAPKMSLFLVHQGKGPDRMVNVKLETQVPGLKFLKKFISHIHWKKGQERLKPHSLNTMQLSSFFWNPLVEYPGGIVLSLGIHEIIFAPIVLFWIFFFLSLTLKVLDGCLFPLLSVWSFYVLPISIWILSGWSGFLPRQLSAKLPVSLHNKNNQKKTKKVNVTPHCRGKMTKEERWKNYTNTTRLPPFSVFPHASFSARKQASTTDCCAAHSLQTWHKKIKIQFSFQNNVRKCIFINGIKVRNKNWHFISNCSYCPYYHFCICEMKASEHGPNDQSLF